MDRWYEDRFFPEIKASNSDIVAVVPDLTHRQRIIKEHNEVVGEWLVARSEARILRQLIADLKNGDITAEQYEEGLKKTDDYLRRVYD